MIARMHVHAGLKANKTYLKDCYYTPPLKLANITEDRRERDLKLMLMSSSPGILDGDEYEVRIRLDQQTCLSLQTQSYQRLFAMQKGAVQNMEVRMEEGSFFSYLPHPTVPHRHANYSAKNRIYLTTGCSLLWGEIVTCGRKQTDEVFQFSRYQAMTEIFFNDKLVVKDNVVLTPAKSALTAIGQFEGYTHQGSLLYVDEKLAVGELISIVDDILVGTNGICAGVSALPLNGLIVRILGNKAEQLFELIKSVASVLRAKRLIDHK